MNIVVFGSGGMLGKAVVAEASQRNHVVFPYPHNRCDISAPAEVMGALWTATGGNLPPRREEIAVINCAGKLPFSADPADIIRSNSLGPHVVARMCRAFGSHLVHVSTDCVFSGKVDYRPMAYDPPDATDLYGMSKALGETFKLDASPPPAVVRTSFIGPDHGLLHWLMHEHGVVRGFHNAYWAGSTVYAVARGLLDIAESGEAGIIHLSTAIQISKHALLELLVERLRLDIRVVPIDEPVVFRALKPTHELDDIHKVVDELISICQTPSL